MFGWYWFWANTMLATGFAVVDGAVAADRARDKKQNRAAMHGYLNGLFDGPDCRPYLAADLRYCFERGQRIGTRKRAARPGA